MSCPPLLRRSAVAAPHGDPPRAPEQGAEPEPKTRTARLAAWLRTDRALAQFARFVLVGGSTTLLYALLFVSLERHGYLAAHVLATAASTVLANELHRRLTFHAGERVGWFTAQWEAGGVALIGLLATSAALGWLDTMAGDAHVALQISLVIAVTGFIGLIRFITLRWLFRPRRAAGPA